MTNGETVLGAEALVTGAIVTYRSVAQAHVVPPPYLFTDVVVVFVLLGLVSLASPSLAAALGAGMVIAVFIGLFPPGAKGKTTPSASLGPTVTPAAKPAI